MSVFPKIRAAAGYIAGTGPGELVRARAAVLLARLDACDDILAACEGDVPAGLHGLLRDLILAVRDLAGPAWLDASSDDPDVTAFTLLEAAASPPDPAWADEICSRVLWARFAPPGGGQDKDTAASTARPSRRVPGAAHPGQAAGPAGTAPGAR
jgi:hypothetical protein